MTISKLQARITCRKRLWFKPACFCALTMCRFGVSSDWLAKMLAKYAVDIKIEAFINE